MADALIAASLEAVGGVMPLRYCLVTADTDFEAYEGTMDMYSLS